MSNILNNQEEKKKKKNKIKIKEEIKDFKEEIKDFNNTDEFKNINNIKYNYFDKKGEKEEKKEVNIFLETMKNKYIEDVKEIKDIRVVKIIKDKYISDIQKRCSKEIEETYIEAFKIGKNVEDVCDNHLNIRKISEKYNDCCRFIDNYINTDKVNDEIDEETKMERKDNTEIMDFIDKVIYYKKLSPYKLKYSRLIDYIKRILIS